MQKEIRAVDPFKRIKFKDIDKLVLTQGAEGSLTIEADEAMLPEILSEVQDDTLILDITISGLGQEYYHSRPQLRQVISGLGKSKKVD